MKSYASDRLRNVVLMGHGGAGKTTLGEAMLLASGAISRLGNVDDGTTVSDYDDEEHGHRYSISASLLAIEWNDARINLIDAPGYADFEGELVSGARAADSALIAVDASSGVQAGTELAWERADEAGPLPRVVVVTRLDRENTDFGGVVAQLRERFGNRVVPLALPVGVASAISGFHDLRSADAPPDELADELDEARTMLVEAVAETDDELLEKYLDGQELSRDEITRALHDAIARGEVIPVVPTCATAGIGIDGVLNNIVNLMPSPLGREHVLAEGSVITSPDGPLVVQVFKTIADPFVGHLSFMKVLSGTLPASLSPYNARNRATERLGHLYLQRGKEQIEVPELVAGDIGVAAKLSDTHTGDTLVASAEQAVQAAPLAFPRPTYRTALHPASQDDVNKLASALQRLQEQDRTIHVDRDPDTGETIMTTIGDAQVAIACARLAKTYGVEVRPEVPRVPYRETVSGKAKAEYKHKKQTGGHGQYGHVVIEIEPLTRGMGFEFAQQVVGGNVPRQFIPAVEKGISETLPDGPLAHSPIVDVKVTLLDGSAHAVDSSEMAFKMAASHALKDGLLEAHPILLEPVMKLRVHVPGEYVGDVMSDISTKRGHVHGVEGEGAFSMIEADVPLAEVQRYTTDLRAVTHGRGRFELAFDRYVEVPPHVQEEVIVTLRNGAMN
jgi:elongation factor G